MTEGQQTVADSESLAMQSRQSAGVGATCRAAWGRETLVVVLHIVAAAGRHTVAGEEGRTVAVEGAAHSVVAGAGMKVSTTLAAE